MDQFPTFEEIRSSILRDTLSLDPGADTHEGSDHFVHASRLASCAEGQYAHQAWVLRHPFKVYVVAFDSFHSQIKFESLRRGEIPPDLEDQESDEEE